MRTELPRALQKPDALFAGHSLVGHQQADFVGVLFEQFEAGLGIGRRQNPKLILKGAREVF